MSKSKEKTELAVMDIVDDSKPIIKPFFDRDAEIIKFINLMLPSVPNSIMKAHQVYCGPRRRVLRFRVNYFQETWEQGSFCPTFHIVLSKYIQVININDSKFEINDLTK